MWDSGRPVKQISKFQGYSISFNWAQAGKLSHENCKDFRSGGWAPLQPDSSALRAPVLVCSGQMASVLQVFQFGWGD